MANRYETEGKALERRRQIAESLRASGNEPLPASIHTGGALDAPVSGWAYFDKALKQALGGYLAGKADKDEKKLSEQQQEEQRQWLEGLGAGIAPDELRPVRNTNQLMDVPKVPGQDSMAPLQSSLNPATGNIEGPPIGDRAPVGLQQQMANALRGQQQYAQDEGATQASDKQRMVSYALKGIDIGGLPAALGGALAERALLPTKYAPVSLAADASLVDPNTGKVIATGVPKALKDERTDDIKEYESAVKEGYKGSLEDWILSQKRAGASSQTVHLPPQENAEAIAVGKGFGETYVNLQQSGRDATSKLAKYDRMAQLLEGVNTGKLAPTFAQIAAVGESFGVTLDPTLGEKQALEALSGEVALTLRNPSGGAGMPGALSDKDREFLMSMTPGLGKTPEGNKLIIETARVLAKRDQEVASLARKYRQKNGKLDEGFDEELAAFGLANELFSKYTGANEQSGSASRPPLSSFQAP